MTSLISSFLSRPRVRKKLPEGYVHTCGHIVPSIISQLTFSTPAKTSEDLAWASIGGYTAGRISLFSGDLIFAATRA